MTPLEAKRFGAKTITKGAICLFFIIEFALMLSKTQGDFANGIVFFINEQQNIYFVLAVVLYFFTNSFLGMQAAFLIISKKKEHEWVAFFLGLLSCLLSIIYYAGYIFLLNNSIDSNYNKEHQDIILNSLFNGSLFLLFPMMLMWFWASKKMHLQLAKPDN